MTVARVAPADFTETVLATGSLVAREEILVGPEVEGLRITEVLADEGAAREEGRRAGPAGGRHARCPARAERRGLARTAAAIAQAKAAIVQAEARLVESRNALRARQAAAQAGHMTEAVFDQREQAARTAEAQLAAAQDGLKLAEAEKAQVEAQRRELMWRRGRVEVTAPADGIISRRMARVGGYAAGRRRADVPHRRQGRGGTRRRGDRDADAAVKDRPDGARRGGGPRQVEGTVRLVSPEVDKSTRLGRVRIFLGDNPGLRVGAFARGTDRYGQRPRVSPCRPRPSSTAPDGATRAGRARQPRRDPQDQDRARRRRAGGGARRARRGRPRGRALRHVPARRRCGAAGAGRTAPS